MLCWSIYIISIWLRRLSSNTPNRSRTNITENHRLKRIENKKNSIKESAQWIRYILNLVPAKMIVNGQHLTEITVCPWIMMKHNTDLMMMSIISADFITVHSSLNGYISGQYSTKGKRPTARNLGSLALYTNRRFASESTRTGLPNKNNLL